MGDKMVHRAKHGGTDFKGVLEPKLTGDAPAPVQTQKHTIQIYDK
jgi:hypothetical protein